MLTFTCTAPMPRSPVRKEGSCGIWTSLQFLSQVEGGSSHMAVATEREGAYRQGSWKPSHISGGRPQESEQCRSEALDTVLLHPQCLFPGRRKASTLFKLFKKFFQREKITKVKLTCKYYLTGCVTG